MLKTLFILFLLFSFPMTSYSNESLTSTAEIGQLNGHRLPGVIARSLSQKRLITLPDGMGKETIIEQTTRAANTRTPIHLHEYGGITCVIEGEMTLFLENTKPKLAVAGECYEMPAGLRMAGFNSGRTNAVMHDIFTLPLGGSVWQVTESGSKEFQDQFQHH